MMYQVFRTRINPSVRLLSSFLNYKFFLFTFDEFGNGLKHIVTCPIDVNTKTPPPSPSSQRPESTDLADESLEKCAKTESMKSSEEEICLPKEGSEIASFSSGQDGMELSKGSGMCSSFDKREKSKDSKPSSAFTKTLTPRIAQKLKNNLSYIRWIEYSPYAKDLFKTNKWESIQDELISVVSYNVLSQTLLERHRYLYNNHDEKALKWGTRSQVLIKEFAELDADILCLQEVDSSLFYSFYNRHLEKLGYQGIYKRRTNGKVDGCAIFFKNKKFNLITHLTVELFKPFVNLLNRDNIGIILKLSLKSNPDTEFVIATTHLLYNPKRGDIKLVQTQMLLAEMEKIAYLRHNSLTQKSEYLPIIFTGDMNYSPDNGVYQLVTKSFLEYEGKCSEHLIPSVRSHAMGHTLNKTLLPSSIGITDSCQYASSLRGRKGNKGMSFSTGVLDHFLNLESVYKHVKSDLPEATTNQDRWVTVDYIFYSQLWDSDSRLKMEGNLKLISKLTLPNSEEAEEYLRHIPNLYCGSDHLPLMATFQVKPCGLQESQR